MTRLDIYPVPGAGASPGLTMSCIVPLAGANASFRKEEYTLTICLFLILIKMMAIGLINRGRSPIYRALQT